MAHKTAKPKNGHAQLHRLWTNPRYRGKHVLVVAGHTYVAQSGAEATRLFERVTRQYPKARPTLAYIPKADTLILWRTA